MFRIENDILAEHRDCAQRQLTSQWYCLVLSGPVEGMK
jgi:hypothetical protein